MIIKILFNKIINNIHNQYNLSGYQYIKTQLLFLLVPQVSFVNSLHT